MKKYEVHLAGYRYPFKVLAYNAQQTENKVKNFIKHPKKAVKVGLTKRQKIYVGYPFPVA